MPESDAWPWVEFLCPDASTRDRLFAELDGGEIVGCEEWDAAEVTVLRVYWNPECTFEKVIGEAGRFADICSVTVGQHGVQAREDWLRHWKDHFHPLKVSERIWVCPPWEQPATQAAAQVIIIDPQMAFGTGTHPTTQLCIRYLEQYVRPGINVLDVGTGSGILAIAAAKLGAGSVLAIESDPEACPNARANIERNGVSGAVTLLEQPFEGGLDSRADVVVCNIITAALLPLIPALAAAARDGVVILSGISHEHRGLAVVALHEADLVIDREDIRGEWWVCACTPRGGRAVGS